MKPSIRYNFSLLLALLFPTLIVSFGPSSCKEFIDALETCAETALQSGSDGASSDICSEQISDLEECLDSATPDDTIDGNITLPPVTGVLSCFYHIAFYDACVAITNATSPDNDGSCSTKCIIDGPDQNCGDYEIVYCERQSCCDNCTSYMTEYDQCIANVGECTAPSTCSSAITSSMTSISLISTVVGIAGAISLWL